MDGHPQRRSLHCGEGDRSRFCFLQDQRRGAVSSDGTESPRPRAGWVGRIPTTGRGRAAGRSARWQEDGTVPADFTGRILFLCWVMTPAGAAAAGTAGGRTPPRLNQSVTSAQPARTICSHCPDSSAGPVRVCLRPEREERPRPESCPAGLSAGRICRTI